MSDSHLGIKVGDIVRWNKDGWHDWVGIVEMVIPGWAGKLKIMWFKDNNVRTSCTAYDLEVLSESR